MRLVAMLVVGCGLFGSVAFAQSVDPVSLDNPAYSDPARQWQSIEDAEFSEEVPAGKEAECRETVRHVRDEAGQAELRREPAGDHSAHLMKAVDKRIDGCPVMVMDNAAEDVRPLPKVEPDLNGLVPAQ
ncbi:hypothetical protein [Qipengyuania sp. JC766]|uniref:hypothetical protein n=1 Tax=Qipengyuania sp. JC766 TaxID=3232139 RepID=UPI003458E0D7